MRLLLTVISIFLYASVSAQFKGLIINEFSQGDQGAREYIELLIVGKRTCNDSTADIRGWIVDDQNGWYGNTATSSGHYRFKNIPLWASVPFGSIILLYNSASGEKNLSITAADDPADANKDYTYILPINSNAYLEEHDNEPDNNALTPSFIYPPAASTAGYSGTQNLWGQHIALNNTGDVLSVISRNKRDSAFFSIGYGYTINTGFRAPTVSIANAGAGLCVRLTDSVYALASRWNIAAAPSFETPGASNGGINTTWITAMRTTPQAVHTYTTACSNGPYSFFGQTITTTGPYTVLYTNSNTCVDTNDLYVVIKKTDVKDTTACDSLVYNGIKYTANATITDHISSVVINCDSIVRTLNIKINKSSSSLTKNCVGIGQSFVFNGNSYNTSGLYAVTLTNSKGCDSIAKLFLTATVLQTTSIIGCGSVIYKGNSYTASTIIYDTVKSLVTACDSIIKKTLIQVNPVKNSFVPVCANEGDSYSFNGQPVTASGNYTASLLTHLGCDSIVTLYIVFKKRVQQNFTGCDSVTVNGVRYFQSIILADTIRSVVTNCDSLISIKNIVVNRSNVISLSACTQNSYLFFGLTLTTGGNYSHLLTTSSGCDSLIKLYLVVTQLQTQTISGCDSVIFNNHIYHASVQLRDTVRSIITACDSLITIINIVVNPVKHTYLSACLAPGQTYLFNNQALSVTGNYTASYSTATCDSIVHLYLVAAKEQVLNYAGCDSVIYQGAVYYAPTVLHQVILSSVTGCDSIIKTITITVNYELHTYSTFCVQQGSVYNFNGQSLTATGSYTTRYSTNVCDSIVHLYLSVAASQTQTVSGCDSVSYRGQFYYNSFQLSDTTKSLISGCDSLYKITHIVVSKKAETYITLCRKQGEIYNLNGQLLTSSGNYVTTFSRPNLCDSTVHLYLTVSSTRSQTIIGCGSVIYKGIVYTSSVTISDTVKSIVTNCDSIIQVTTIQVNQKPFLQLAKDLTICKGDTIILTASSPGNLINWLGFAAAADTLKVSPDFTTVFTASVTATNGCTNTGSVIVSVQDFSLNLFVTTNAVLTGTKVHLQTSGTLPYSVYNWQPSQFLPGQTAKSQQLIADSSVVISVAGVTNAGCKDTAYLSLLVTPVDDVYVPSGFTPNGDGKNDEVRVAGSSIATIDFKIFNRWGQMVFTTRDKSKGWDGKLSGKLQPVDSYVYVVKAKKNNGQIVDKRGTILLIR